MAFNIFTTKRVFYFRQYHRIDHLVTCNLRGDKRTDYQQFLVGEFDFPAVCKCFDPLLLWHVAPIRGEVNVCRKYTSLGAKTCKTGSGKFAFADEFVTFRVSWPPGVTFPYRPASAICQSFLVNLP